MADTALRKRGSLKKSAALDASEGKREGRAKDRAADQAVC